MICKAEAAHGQKRGGYSDGRGESRIGKTRLAAELALRVEAEGGRVLWGNATAELVD